MLQSIKKAFLFVSHSDPEIKGVPEATVLLLPGLSCLRYELN